MSETYRKLDYWIVLCPDAHLDRLDKTALVLKAQTVECRDLLVGLEFKQIIDDGFEFTLEPTSTYRLLTRLSEAGFVGLVEPDLWDAQDASVVIDLWDQDDPEPFYLAEEQDDWRVGWDDVKDYLGPPGRNKTTEAMRMRFHSIQAKLLAPDLAFASFWIRFDAKMNFLPKPIGNDSRASAVFRKKPAGWRLVAWTEAPQSPLVYIQKLYEMNVHPEFDAFRKVVTEDGSE